MEHCVEKVALKWPKLSMVKKRKVRVISYLCPRTIRLLSKRKNEADGSSDQSSLGALAQAGGENTEEMGFKEAHKCLLDLTAVLRVKSSQDEI